jgi:hypothetical protein
MVVKKILGGKTQNNIDEFKIIARFLLDENRRTTYDRDEDLYLDEFVGLLTSFYRLPAHKRDFARELLEKAQRWFELNVGQAQDS